MRRLKEQLTHRERVRLALNHQTTDRIPIAMVCSGINYPASEQFEQLLIEKHQVDLPTYLWRVLDIAAVQPKYTGPPLPEGTDIWGVRRKAQSFGAGAYDEIAYYPLSQAKTVKDLQQHRWPSPDWFDYTALDDSIALANAGEERCLMIQNANIFESAWYMRGFEQALMDFYDNPELIVAILERTADFYCTYFRQILQAAEGRIDLAFTADDIGGQNGLLMSLATWEQFIQPFHRQLNRVIHDFGVKVIYHTDGAVMKAVPGLMEMGIDVLQALQFSAKGMDARLLKEKYGDRLCFEGGISVQTTLPFGSVEDVRQETLDLMTVLGKDGGYILGPSHAIQAGTPPENIYAMFEAALNEYPF